MKEFVKVNMTQFRQLTGLSKSEKLLLIELSDYLKFNTNLLINKNGTPLRQIDICREFNMLPANVSLAISKFIKIGQIRKVIFDGKKYFAINNELFEKG